PVFLQWRPGRSMPEVLPILSRPFMQPTAWPFFSTPEPGLSTRESNILPRTVRQVLCLVISTPTANLILSLPVPPPTASRFFAEMETDHLWRRSTTICFPGKPVSLRRILMAMFTPTSPLLHKHTRLL